GIIAGIGMGLFNGLMVAKLEVPPFITTLVVGQVSQGLALIMNNGRSIGGFPASYVHIGNGSFLGIPVSDLLLLVMMGIGIFITQFTPTGNRIYALGGNETVVRQEGINLDELKLFVYGFSLPTEGARSRAQMGPGAANRRPIRRTDGGDPERREPAEDGLRKMARHRATAPSAG